MAELLASKVVIQEEEPQLRSIPAESTAVIAVVGVAQRGPVGVATLITSWDEYVRIFGGYTADGELPMAVRGIYRQDPGAYVYVVRTVHYTDITSAATKTSAQAEIMVQGTQATASAGAVTSAQQGAFNLEPGQTLDIHVDEDGGGPETATFDAARAVAAGSGLSIVDLTGDTLILSIDGGDSQTITFSGSEASAQDVANTINANLLGGTAVVNTGEVDIYGDIRGTAGEVDITGGTALTEIGHSIGTSSGTGDVANINAVTFAEAKAVIENDVTTAPVTVTEETTGEITITSDTTGASSSVQVEVSSTATGFGFDNVLHSGSASTAVDTLKVLGKYDGTYAHDLRAVVGAATSGVANEFNLSVTDADGVVLEVFPNLVILDTTDERYCETIVNQDVDDGGSRYIELEDQLVPLRPDNGTYTPASGDDGLTSLDDNDFLGDAAGLTGLHALDQTQGIRIVLAPGRATSAVHNGLITYCESDRDGSCFAVLDPPSGQTAAQMVTYVKTTASLYNTSEFAAIYWPQIKVLNPSKDVYGNTDNITVPPAAWVAGVYSRTDRSQPGGIYQPPAGIERGRIFGCLGFETEEVLDERKRDLVYPARINPISREAGTSRFIDGTRTLKGNGNFPSVAERRGVIFIEQSIKGGTIFARHSNNDAALRARIFRTVFQFLKTQMNLGAFRTKDTDTAFFVDVSDALNPPSVVFQNKVIGRVGLATQKPADYIVFFFSQDTRALLEELGE
jgi:phage tail sheath protein FI